MKSEIKKLLKIARRRKEGGLARISNSTGVEPVTTAVTAVGPGPSPG